ncbi:MAG TPA: TIGR04282 family arsenosugar biosynthesis glycosyltransferase [Saprospiraceae bacterium]|nr:TIGR04282 family arsenosugar biosynthesis glycosyltransferase [Saprospiraceae bacterium]
MHLPALIIFVKNPVLGRVKTRLAAEVGLEKALEVYFDLLHRARRCALEYPGEKRVYYSDWIPEHDFWETNTFQKNLQMGGDLGMRMSNAFDDVLMTAGPALLIGSDCPYLTSELLLDAAHQLELQDCVLGPAKDGGYYLIGLRKPVSGIFEDITWSSGSVLQQTLSALQKAQASYHLLPTLEDIDTLADWNRFVSSLDSGGTSL